MSMRIYKIYIYIHIHKSIYIINDYVCKFTHPYIYIHAIMYTNQYAMSYSYTYPRCNLAHFLMKLMKTILKLFPPTRIFFLNSKSTNNLRGISFVWKTKRILAVVLRWVFVHSGEATSGPQLQNVNHFFLSQNGMIFERFPD